MENDTKYEYLKLGKGLVQTIKDHYATVQQVTYYDGNSGINKYLEHYINDGIRINYVSHNYVNKIEDIEDDE